MNFGGWDVFASGEKGMGVIKIGVYKRGHEI